MKIYLVVFVALAVAVVSESAVAAVAVVSESAVAESAVVVAESERVFLAPNYF